MSPTRIGVGLAAIVAGPPLYALVQHGQIDLTTALLRAGLVALGCVVGAWWLTQLVNGYALAQRREVVTRRAEAVAAALQEMDKARGQDDSGARDGSSSP